MQSQPNHQGYYRVGLYKNRKEIKKSIHRLVAEVFIINENNYPVINHKDENKANNSVDNLEWCSYKYNSNFGTAQKRRLVNKKTKILQYDLNNNFIKEHDSAINAEKSINILNAQSNIIKCCRGKHKTAYKYIWKYK